MSICFVARANPLTILQFHGDASPSSSVALGHAHWLPRAIAVLIRSLAGQRLIALSGSAPGRFVRSPRRLAAMQAAVVVVVLAYGFPSFAHV
ncbi:hypothetical protein [Burkholderia mayonis]|uniref:hypothetical protein n=1 Tax=Burkholderia mayonis TaxID=1385591 RepID=UPI001CF79228|nr:hypothetical protein [Burkholderia mayonis]